MPRFVILKHETPAGYERPTHWDLMLEREGVLLTWALPAEPAAGKTMAAEKLADHRLAYLDYEGPVAGDRGTVARAGAGVYSVIYECNEGLHVCLDGRAAGGCVLFAKLAKTANAWWVRFSTTNEAGTMN